MTTYTITPVAVAHTPFNEKFGIPRQAGLVDVPAVIELLEPYNHAEAVDGLEQVSHIWLTFVFSGNVAAGSRLKVRPPRLGGNVKIGVFATRSSFRPNALGQSLVRLVRMEIADSVVRLHVTGIDLLDGTPIVDIKPYLPYADRVDDAVNAIAADAPGHEKLKVRWSEPALEQLQFLKPAEVNAMASWIARLIALDPRPAYQGVDSRRDYGMAFFGLDIGWHMVSDADVLIMSVASLRPDKQNSPHN